MHHQEGAAEAGSRMSIAALSVSSFVHNLGWRRMAVIYVQEFAIRLMRY